MRSFDQSQKSKKTVASMIERKSDEKSAPPPKKAVKIVEIKEEPPSPHTNGHSDNDVIALNRKKLVEKLSGKKKIDSK